MLAGRRVTNSAASWSLTSSASLMASAMAWVVAYHVLVLGIGGCTVFRGRLDLYGVAGRLGERKLDRGVQLSAPATERATGDLKFFGGLT